MTESPFKPGLLRGKVSADTRREHTTWRLRYLGFQSSVPSESAKSSSCPFNRWRSSQEAGRASASRSRASWVRAQA